VPTTVVEVQQRRHETTLGFVHALILDADNSSSYHAMRSLSRAGHAVDLMGRRSTPWFTSKHCTTPLPVDDIVYREEASFVAYLLDVVATTRYDLLLCCGDAQAELVYKHQAVLAEHVECFVPDAVALQSVLSKRVAYEKAAAAGLAIPETRHPSSLEEVARLQDGLAYPVVVKGEKGSASSHVRFVTCASELRTSVEIVRALEPFAQRLPMIQEYIDGPGFVVHMLLRHGDPLAVCCHRKDREYPTVGGVTSAATTVDDPPLVEAALAFAKSLCWHGLLKLDFKRDTRSGVYIFIEMDARVSASIDITRAAGVDQIVLLADLTRGAHVKPVLTCKPGVRYRWLFPRDLLCLTGKPRLFPGLLMDVASRKVHFDLDFDDWRPAVRAARQFFRIRSRRWSNGSLVSEEQQLLDLRKSLESTR
jgi:carbamoylphosphate synthase large subunit